MALYNFSELFLLLSFPDTVNRCTEGFGIVLLEAGACKKPVIASRAGGIPEAVLDGETGILVDPDSPEELVEAIKKVLSDKKLAESLAQAGYNRCIREFTWDGSRELVSQILDQ
jgi:phosphatidylinositol alpha-1,6-mannosyltransferase